jgi:hypothetical protein
MAKSELKGVIAVIGQTIDVTEKFTKREFIIETDDQYGPFVKFELTQDRCGLIESYSVGTEITVHYDVKGSKALYTNKNGQKDCFVALQAWKLSSDSAPKGQSKPMTKVADVQPNDMPFDDSDVPF